jgi:hypothetical protein
LSIQSLHNLRPSCSAASLVLKIGPWIRLISTTELRRPGRKIILCEYQSNRVARVGDCRTHNQEPFVSFDSPLLHNDEMTKDLENNYRINNRRSLATALFHIKRLRPFFGFNRAVDVTPDRVKAYQAHRLNEGGAPATINREVACLGKMLTLAVETGKLSRRLRFKLLDGEKIRKGFWTTDSF